MQAIDLWFRYRFFSLWWRSEQDSPTLYFLIFSQFFPTLLKFSSTSIEQNLVVTYPGPVVPLTISCCHRMKKKMNCIEQILLQGRLQLAQDAVRRAWRSEIYCSSKILSHRRLTFAASLLYLYFSFFSLARNIFSKARTFEEDFLSIHYLTLSLKSRPCRIWWKSPPFSHQTCFIHNFGNKRFQSKLWKLIPHVTAAPWIFSLNSPYWFPSLSANSAYSMEEERKAK